MVNAKLKVPGKVVYISGPMTGIEGHNSKAFSAMERRLAEMGAKTVYNPARLIPFSVYAGSGRGMTRPELMRQDFADIMASEVVVMLDGWRRSAGASCEHAMAVELGMDILYE